MELKHQRKLPWMDFEKTCSEKCLEAEVWDFFFERVKSEGSSMENALLERASL